VYVHSPFVGPAWWRSVKSQPITFFSRICYHFQQVCELVKSIENSLDIQI
jgi:hypothetical protein